MRFYWGGGGNGLMKNDAVKFSVPKSIYEPPLTFTWSSWQLLFATPWNKMSPNNGSLLKGVVIPDWMNNQQPSCFFINFDFLLLHIVHFHKKMILSLLVFETFGFTFSVCFLHFKQYYSIAFWYVYNIFILAILDYHYLFFHFN